MTTAARQSRPLVALVNAMGSNYREYLLESIATQFDVWLFEERHSLWAEPYVVGQTLVDTNDVGRLVAEVKSLGADGVLCWDETRILTASKVANALGLPGSEPEAISKCRDKYLTRRALARLSVPQPHSVAVETLDEALAAAGPIGYPVVVKPRALTGSFGVARVNSPEQLKQLLQSHQRNPHG